MQRKVEAKKGLDYCREHCGQNYDKYTASVNATACYWIAKEGQDEPQTASP